MAPAAILAALLLAGCTPADYTRLYHTEPIAPSLSWDELASLDYLGPTLVDRGVNFCVYSEHAERIELALFDDPDDAQPSWQFPLQKYGGSLWNLYVEGVGVGQAYGYIAWGPNWEYDEDFYPTSALGFHNDADAQGNRFNPNKLLTDPYAKAYTRDFDWSRGSAASGPDRTSSTYAAASKSVVVKEDALDRSAWEAEAYQWSEHEEQWMQARREGSLEGHGPSDLVIYEVHLKGFTANTASGVEHPGTYLGVAEKADYLAELGVTAVEFLPVQQKEPSLGGYWGYSTLNYFAPEQSYSQTYATRGDPMEVIDEFKEMVDRLHQAGLEVILDVVYNHTGEGGLWRNKICPDDDLSRCYEFTLGEVASIFSWRGLDNAAYYAVSSDGQDFWDSTGVGHDVRANHAPMRRLILDSLHWWAEEMHVDGFRFDLAAVLGEGDGDYSQWDPEHSVLQDIVDDPWFQENHVRLIAEPWSVNMSWVGGDFPSSSDDPAYAFAEWNGGFRDFWARFINEEWEGYPLNQAEYYEQVDAWQAMHASDHLFGDRRPYHSVNYVTCHDGFTLYDLFSYDEAYNECGVLNPVCCDDPFSVWCDIELNPWGTNARDWGSDQEPLKRQLMRDAFVAVLLAQGTPMILGGDEWMRTQYGNDNAYSQGADNAYNWFRWGEWQSPGAYDRYRMHDFVRKLIAFRKEHADVLAPTEWGHTADWLGPDGTESSANWGGRDILIHYPDDGLAILVNMEAYDVDYQLPGGGSWKVVVDTQSYYDTPARSGEPDGYFSDHPDADPYESANIDLEGSRQVSGSYTARARSIVVFVRD